MNEFRLLIDGELVAGADSIDVVNPATASKFADAPRASSDQLELAVAAAKRAFRGWSSAPEATRRDALNRIAEDVQRESPELAQIFVREHGAPLSSAMLELMVFALKLKGAAAQPIPVHEIAVGPGRKVEQHYRPLGVVAAIVPWNVPLILLGAKLAPALLVGNTVVVKPASTTPLTTLKIGEIIARHVPPGVVNIVSGLHDLGPILATHPDVRMISFTGSTANGSKVFAGAAETIKRMTLELGGNDPAIVLDDADPVAVADMLFRQSMINCGQACVAIKRVYAQNGIHDRLCDELGKRFAAARVGNGLDEGIEFGPMQNERQFERVKELLEHTRQSATLIAQGHAPDGPGYFIAPTLFADVSNGDRLVDEEQFGPLLPVIRFELPEEAIRMANEGIFGLSASVFTADETLGYEIAAQLEAGTVTVNKVLEMHPFVPFGGAKQSGMGVENGELGLAEFAQLQVIDIAA